MKKLGHIPFLAITLILAVGILEIIRGTPPIFSII